MRFKQIYACEHWLRVQWSRLRGYKSFRVEYADGKISRKMTYEVARDYAAMFKGMAHFYPA